MSKRQASRRRGKKEISQKDMWKFNPISLLLTILPVLIMGYLTIKYFGQSFIPFAIILITMGAISLIGTIINNKGSLYTDKISFLQDPPLSALLFGVGILVGVASTLSLFFIFQVLIKFAVSPEDLYLYYGSSALIEEAFFRHFLISTFDKNNKKYWGIIISSLLFAITHLYTYWYRPEMIGIVFFAGIIFSVLYIYYKDVTSPMIVHLIINLITVGNLLVQA